MNTWWDQPSSPQSEPPWSPPDSRRSTLDLIETCVLTLILCSWTAIHLDIPTQYNTRNWTNQRLLCALLAILVPEYFLGIAFEELWESRLICLELKKLESERSEEGGVSAMPPDEKSAVPPDENRTPTVQCLPESNDTVVFPGKPSESHGNPETPPSRTNDQCHNLNARRGPTQKSLCGLWHIVCESWRKLFPPELQRGFYVEMGGFQLVSDLGEGEDLPDGFKGRVTSRGAIELARAGLLPEVSWEMIADQSKSDTLAKVFVCLQASWMIIQCIVRVTRSIPLTLLEVHTLMNAACAFLMYFLWFQKPQDVVVPTKVRVDHEKLKKLKDIVEANSPSLPLDEGGSVSRKFKLADLGTQGYGLDISKCRIPQSENRKISQAVMLLLLTTIYGGVHLTVWKGHFPTNLEKVMWIASALFIIGGPFLAVSTKFFVWEQQVAQERYRWWDIDGGVQLYRDLISRKKWVRLVLFCFLSILLYLGSALYYYARMYLFLESFVSLRSLPLGSYTATPWISWIPHF